MESKRRYTITSALPYTNGKIHIGHLAGAYIPADIYARFKRVTDNDVAYICGSDEHGVAISIRAKKEKKTPKEIIDKYHDLIKKSFSDFGISFDNYSRTSSKIHHKTASEFFKFLENKKVFEIKDSKQLYDPKENQFLADRFVEGECPKCNYEAAYGDQCENCGSSLSPEELINPISKISGVKPIEKETKHWYLPLGNYEEFLKEWFLEGKKNKAKTNVYGQVKSWVDQGLESRAITRDLDWGIPVPSEDGKGKVLYVWFDAPIGYISSTKEWAERENKNWEPYWKDKNTKLVHFIGKDNIVFHCIIFPIILKAHGDYILPENVPANEFLNLEGNKFSTSKNWAIWLDEFLVDFPGMQDSLRYTLTVNAPETKDNDFTWKDFQARNNNELVATFGNFINRVFVLTHKYFDGSVPENSGLNDIDLEVLKKTYEYPKLISESLDNFKFRKAVSLLIDLSRLGNKYLADEEPWKLYKSGELQRVKQIMFVSLQVCGMLAILSHPFLPNASKKIKDIINLKETKWTEINIDNPILNSQNKINKPELIFRKIEDEEIENQIEKLKG
jgi:methionyl-tRNA synthetase